jgi:hypothetical protein
MEVAMPDRITARANDLVLLYDGANASGRAWVLEQLAESADPAAAVALVEIKQRWPQGREHVARAPIETRPSDAKALGTRTAS